MEQLKAMEYTSQKASPDVLICACVCVWGGGCTTHSDYVGTKKI